jgi:hypothetical protein
LISTPVTYCRLKLFILSFREFPSRRLSQPRRIQFKGGLRLRQPGVNDAEGEGMFETLGSAGAGWLVSRTYAEREFATLEI